MLSYYRYFSIFTLTISLAEKSNLQSSLGKLEIAWAAGCSSGPLFASFFYKIGGYPLPFIFTGSCLYISVYLSNQVDTNILKEEEEDEMKVIILDIYFTQKFFQYYLDFLFV